MTDQIRAELQEAPLALGMMRLLDYPELCPAPALAEWIEARLDQGLKVFDHANIYGGGECERLFGLALQAAPELKEHVRLISKCDIVPPTEDGSSDFVKHYNTEAAYVMACVDDSLRRLQVDSIDCFLLHRPDPLMPVENTARVLEDLLMAGKIKSIGVSNFLPEHWRLLADHLNAPLLCNQIELSLLANQSLFDGTMDALRRDQVQTMAWSPLGGGGFSRVPALGDALAAMSAQTGVSETGLALSWLKRIPGRPLPVLGSLREPRINDALAGVGHEMSRTDWYALLEAARGHCVA
ncbi:aldo/keto reductase family oxidoreductase [Hahella sp. HN01]|uniref:aldo/keto reductase n=1 Tax=Hahella sp. HN01 TaxID=2847262 RepID=UPI00353018E2